MSYSFFIHQDMDNVVSIPVQSSLNDAVTLKRKGSSVTSTSVNNGVATFTIPSNKVFEFAGTYKVLLEDKVVQNGEIDVIANPNKTNYITKSDLDAMLSSKAEVNFNDIGYDIILLMGQSNMQGADSSIDELVDVPDPRVMTFPSHGSHADKIIRALDPLNHLNPSTSGVGPGMSFGRWYASVVPGNRRVLLVPCASSSSGFTAGNGAARWNPSLPDPVENLYERTITQAKKAVTSAGSNSRLAGALWIQGEADWQLSTNDYRSYLESVIDGLRSRLSVPQLPFVIGSMLPENGLNGPIAVAHKSIPTRKAFTSYVEGPTGYLLSDGLNVHYNAEGAREMGRRLVGGLVTAKANSNPANLVAFNPPAPVEYPTSAFNLGGWHGASDLNVVDGILQVPSTDAYGVRAAPAIDLTGKSVTWRITGNYASTSADTTVGVLPNAENEGTLVGIQFDYGNSPWTQARVVVNGARTEVNAAARNLGWYRVSEDNGQIVVSYSANGSTYTELHRQASPFDLTSVRPCIITGHWDASQPDGIIQVGSLVIE